MLKPAEFERSYINIRSIPYECTEDGGGRMMGGVLSRGQVLWTERAWKKTGRLIRAYVDGIGVVSVEDRFLLPSH